MAVRGIDDLGIQRNPDFSEYISVYLSEIMMCEAFTLLGNVKRLDLNDKYIYLWQNAKGDIHYSFSIFEKEYYTTSATKLGNVLTKHFGVEVEVVNNTKEYLRKMMGATNALNKVLSDSERHNSYGNRYGEQNLFLNTNLKDIPLTEGNLLQILDTKLNNNASGINQIPNHYLHDQEKLFSTSIQLSTFNLESQIGTYFIKLDELPVIYKEKFEPSSKQAFFTDINGLNIRNKFLSTQYMVYPYNLCDSSKSFIIQFIFFMAKKDIHQAFKILLWVTESYRLNKLPFALVLHSQDDAYMKLFYEGLLEPLFNDFQCEKIKNEGLGTKELSSDLDEKFIYNFHNISASSIFGEASHELTNRLIHKDSNKINKKSIVTVGNILITSTSKYIPMINKDLLCSSVEIDSSIDALCKYFNERLNEHEITKCIKNDIPNFVSIIRNLDLQALNKAYPVVDSHISYGLLDGDTDAIKVFDRIIRDRDITPFKSISKTKSDEKIIEEINDNFNRNRVDKAHLLKYFELLFGKSIYRSNRALISILGKDYSKTNEPFDNLKTHVRSGRGYYILSN